MKFRFFILLMLISAGCFGQKQKKVSAYADFHVNATQYDRTLSNNAGGFGIGLQTFINIKSKFRPGIEFNSDAFGGTKELYLTPDGKPIYAKSVTGNILIGSSYPITKRFYINVAGGPSFFNSQVHFTVKPAIGFYFPASQLLVAKISHTHVFQRDAISNESFGFLNFAIGIKLF
jgi:hypothetical protein